MHRLGSLSFPGGSVVKNLPANAGKTSLLPGWGRSLEKGLAATPVFLPGECRGQMSLAGYSPWDGKQPDMSE